MIGLVRTVSSECRQQLVNMHRVMGMPLEEEEPITSAQLATLVQNYMAAQARLDCRNAWPMWPTPIRQSAFRVLSDSGVGSYLVLRQQKSSRAICIHPSEDTAQCKVCRYKNLKAMKHTFKGKFTYLHVYGHMDKYLLWHQLSLIQLLNCVCNTLAKQAVTLAMTQGYHD